MDLEALSKRFFVRALETEDVDIIYDLCSKNKLFYEFHQPFVTRESILDDRNALPPGKSKEDKAYIGLFDGDTLVAVMDLILGYPTEEIVWIGFFMMDTAYQNQGIGTQIIQEAVEAMKNGDADVVQMRDQYNERRRYLLHRLKNMGLKCFEPFGAFYIFPSIKEFGMTSDEFANRLLFEQKLAVVPGTAFGASGEGFVRISYAYSVEKLKAGLGYDPIVNKIGEGYKIGGGGKA